MLFTQSFHLVVVVDIFVVASREFCSEYLLPTPVPAPHSKPEELDSRLHCSVSRCDSLDCRSFCPLAVCVIDRSASLECQLALPTYAQ